MHVHKNTIYRIQFVAVHAMSFDVNTRFNVLQPN